MVVDAATESAGIPAFEKSEFFCKVENKLVLGFFLDLKASAFFYSTFVSILSVLCSSMAAEEMLSYGTD